MSGSFLERVLLSSGTANTFAAAELRGSKANPLLSVGCGVHCWWAVCNAGREPAAGTGSSRIVVNEIWLLLDEIIVSGRASHCTSV